MTERMADVSHTHRDHDARLQRCFSRGPSLVTDGGRDIEGDRTPERDADEETMGEVSHTPPDGDGANRVWDGTHVYERDDRASPRDEDDE